jgi:hypothetical protein
MESSDRAIHGAIARSRDPIARSLDRAIPSLDRSIARSRDAIA